MATDLEKLVVQLSADIRGFDKELARMNGVTNRQFNAIERRARQMNKNLDGIFARSFRGLAAPVVGIGAALGAREIIQLADTWTDLTSRVNLAAGSMDAGASVMARLGEVARRTYSGLEQTAEGYLLNATAMRELGYSTDQTLDYTEAVNNALVISGAKGQTAATVMEALSKAMALGKLSGQNLNTVIQSGGRLAEALAAGLGVTTNQLRTLGQQGKITGRDIVQALSKQMEALRKEADSMPATISDGVQLLQNALLEYVGNADQATGISARISEALVIMADNFDKTADVALQLAGVLAGGLLGRSMVNMVRTLGLGTTALVQFTRALTAARSMATLATAFGGLSAAAGPVGILVGGAVATALIVAASNAGEARDRIDRLNDEMDRLGIKAKPAAESVDEAADAIDNLANESRVQLLKDINDELDRMRGTSGIWAMLFGRDENSAKELGDLIRQAGNQIPAASGVNRDALSSIVKILGDLKYTKITAEEARTKIAEIGKMDISEGVKKLNAEILKSIDHWETVRKTQALSADVTELEGYLQSLDDINGILSQMAEGKIITDAQHRQLQQVIEELKTTGQVSEASKEALASIANVKFAGSIIAEINAIIPKLRTLAEEAIAAGTTIQQMLAGPTEKLPEPDTWDRSSRLDPSQIDMARAAVWEREQLRRARLGKDQLALENEIARVRKQASDDNEKLTEAQIRRIAEANLAGTASRSAQGKKPKQDRDAKAYENLTVRINENIAAMQAENAVLASINPLIDDYGYALEKARMQQELLTAAEKSGVEITPDLRANIDQLADSYARASVETARLQEAHDKVRQSAEDMRDLGRDVLGGFIKDLQAGKSASEALAGALQKVADKLLDIALNSLFSGKGGLFGGGGGLLGGAIIPGILHGGGVAGSDGYGHGRSVSPAVFAGAPRYHKGGIAGLRPDEIPAILQRGEIVLPKGARMAGASETIRVVLQDDSGRMAAIADQRIETASGTIVQVSIQQSSKAVRQQLPGMIADAQTRKM